MTLNLMMPQHDELKPRITVFGVGGAGGNAVNNMIEQQLDGVEFVVANTDAQALAQSLAQAKVQMGVKVTEGLGAGARPSVGAAAAEETIEEIVDHLAGAHMCFITAGMGGGTGTGAAPIIAQAARELGVLTVGVVTKPFQFEGAKRMRQAEEGVEALQKQVDTLIIIPNQNLFRLANEKTTFTEAFAMADDVLYQGVKGVTDLMVRPGLINLDFADVRAVMDEMGKAMMGTGEAEGDDRALQAAEKAIANPLLDEISLNGAKGVLINVTGGPDLTLFELDEAANVIREKVDQDANIIVGSTLDESMSGRMRVSVVATGIDASEKSHDIPVPRRRMAEPLAAPAPRAEDQAPQHYQQQPEPMRAERSYQPLDDNYDDEPAEVAHSADRNFFDDVDTGRGQAGEPPVQDIFGEPMNAADDDLPAPAYQPERQAQPAPQPQYAPQPRQQAPQQAAPRQPQPAPQQQPAARREPGQPSAEAIARLRNAVNSAPRQNAERAQQPQQAPQQGGQHGERKGFGINSLINRMTGHQDAAGGAGGGQAAAARRQPPVQRPAEEEEMSAEQERIEIPAFLRRQAN